MFIRMSSASRIKTVRLELLWVAEVETEDTITLHKAPTRWRQYAALDVSLFLIVPVGYRDLASLVAQHARRAGRRHLYLLVR